MPSVLSSGPANAVVSTADQKTFMRVTTSDEDTLIDTFVDAATKIVENYLNRKLINQTWDYWLDRIPRYKNEPWWNGQREGRVSSLIGFSDKIYLPFAPLSSISSITSYDTDNSSDTFDSDSYTADTQSKRPRVILNEGYSWPTALRDRNAIQITAIYGYGATSASVPADIILAVKSAATILYESRGQCSVDKIIDSINNIVGGHKVFVVSDGQV